MKQTLLDTAWARQGERPREKEIQPIHYLFKLITPKNTFLPQRQISQPFFFLMSLFPAFIINAAGGTDLHFGF